MADDYDSLWEDEDSVGSDSKPKKSARTPTVQELNAQIIKLERENFQLKLRIHLNETKGTVEPITAAGPKKSQREFQFEQEFQALRTQKEEYESKIRQLQTQLHDEALLREKAAGREALLRKKLSQLKNYAQILEAEKLSHRHSGCSGLVPNSHPNQSLTSIMSSMIPTASVGVNTEPSFQMSLDDSQFSRDAGGTQSSQNALLQLHNAEKEAESLRQKLQSVFQERTLLRHQISASEEARKREAVAMGKRLKETLAELTKVNRALRLDNEALKLEVTTANAKAAAMKKAASLEVASQLAYHQTALEKVHQEQALLIAELQKLKKSCPMPKQPLLTGLCSGTRSKFLEPHCGRNTTVGEGEIRSADSSQFISSPRSLEGSERASVCLFDTKDSPGGSLTPSLAEPDNPNNGDAEQQIASMNRKLHEKNSKLALKLRKTRESLKRAVAMLEHSEKDKEGMEKIICRQLHRTHLILSQVKDTISKSREGDPSNSSQSTPRTYSDFHIKNPDNN